MEAEGTGDSCLWETTRAEMTEKKDLCDLCMRFFMYMKTLLIRKNSSVDHLFKNLKRTLWSL